MQLVIVVGAVKRILILALVMSLILNSYSISDRQELSVIPSEDPLVQLSYTSRDRVRTTVFESGATLWGDHVLLNATFCPANENVTASRLSLITSEGENFTILSDNRTVIYDTYQIGKNATVSVQFRVTLMNGTQLSFHYDSIDINNFFRPYLSSISVTGSGQVKTIHWSSTDLNVDDRFVSDLYLTYEGATKWWLLEGNITEGSYHWDTLYYYHAIFRLKVIVRDNDTVYHPRGLNESVWPGLRGEILSSAFSWTGWSDFTALPGWNVTVYPYRNTNYSEGMTGSEIRWYKRVSMFGAFADLSAASYTIYLNETEVQTGNITYGLITIGVDGLSAGVYNYSILVNHKGFYAKDTVLLYVYPKQVSEPEFDYFALAMIVMFSFVLLGIVSCIIQKRQQRRSRVLPTIPARLTALCR